MEVMAKTVQEYSSDNSFEEEKESQMMQSA
jgi:hypothetical protein